MRITASLFSVFVLLGVTGCAPGATGEAGDGDQDLGPAVAGDVVTESAPLPAAEANRINAYIQSRTEGIEISTVVRDASGQAFDCAPVEQQPGLRRRDPSGRVTFRSLDLVPDDVKQEAESRRVRGATTQGEETAEIEGVRCPAGTVPLKQQSFDAIARFGSLEAYLKRHFAAPSITGHEYAKTDYYGDNTGGAGVFNLWSPFTASDAEFSLSQIWIVRGSGSDKQTIEAGWQDYPNRTGAHSPHFFVYSTQDGYGSTGCYDDDCDDWVQLSSTYSPGMGWSNYSVQGGAQYVFDMSIYRSSGSGNWYLIYKGDVMGYYPASLYDSAGLASKAARVSFGGEVAIDNSVHHSSTDMGSGHFASEGWQHAAYTRTLEYRSTSSVWDDIPYASVSTYVTDANCYSIDLNNGSSPWNTNFYFGGPGYNASCP